MNSIARSMEASKLCHLDDFREWFSPSSIMAAANASIDDIKRERAAKCVMLQQYDALLDSDISAMVLDHREDDYMDLIRLISSVAGAMSVVGEENEGTTVKVTKDQFSLIKFRYERAGES